MPEQSPALESKVAALCRPEAYPDRPPSVRAVETHMSWVFLTAQHAFKLKKPVRYDGLDFGTLATRRFFCAEELRLNRRLAQDVYLAVVALRRDSVVGTLRIGGDGAVVDWLVMMRRLPEHLMLDHLLAQGMAQPDQALAVARRLAAFYLGLRPAVSDAGSYLERLRADVADCEFKLCDPEVAVCCGEARRLCAQLRAMLDARPEVFADRVRAGRIVEGHGDLRPEHVCMEEPPAIIDCLEFSAQLRTLDVADELGFLALEFERLGAPGLGAVLFDTYGQASGDFPDAALVDFYQGFRACIRAALAIAHLKEARYRGSPKWPLRAQHYLRLAAQHLERW